MRAHQDAFLAAYEQTLDITGSAKAAGLTRQAHYEWLAGDPTYVQRYKEARIKAFERAESEAVRRAVQGVPRFRVSGGSVVMDPDNPDKPLVERHYSDDLLKFVLKANDGRYRDRQEVRHTGPTGGAVQVAVVNDDVRRAVAAVMADPKLAEALTVLGEGMAELATKEAERAERHEADSGTDRA